jgi:hypothetical protein
MSGIGLSVVVVGVTYYLPGGRQTLPVRIIVYAGLTISMQSDGLLDKVLINKVGFGKILCRVMTIG